MMATPAEHFFAKHARNIKGFLLDISGVLFNDNKSGGESIVGSAESIRQLREAGIPFKLCTNISREKTPDIVNYINAVGFEIKQCEVLSPVPLLKKRIKDRGLRPYLIVSEAVREEFSDVNQKDPNCVVVCTSEDCFTYDRINRAFQVLISSPDPVLLSAGPGKFYHAYGDLTMDLGGFTKALEYACGITSEIVGKPAAEFFLSALNDMQLQPEEAIMIGDDIVNDVAGAQACGIKGVQVRTGKFRPMDENHPTVTPDCYVDDLHQAIQLYLAHK